MTCTLIGSADVVAIEAAGRRAIARAESRGTGGGNLRWCDSNMLKVFTRAQLPPSSASGSASS
jgi:hypothetical protein